MVLCRQAEEFTAMRHSNLLAQRYVSGTVLVQPAGITLCHCLICPLLCWTFSVSVANCVVLQDFWLFGTSQFGINVVQCSLWYRCSGYGSLPLWKL
jgi:hypothetical protein